MSRPQQFTKVNLKPKKHHGYSAMLWIFGTLFPPLAVAARFGIGKDFWLNLLLTVCGYIPGHVHNFYIQNIRNNKNNKRTPKWAIRYGLVDTTEIERKKKKSQWATRYGDRLPNSTLEGQEFEEGQGPGTPGGHEELPNEPIADARDGELWGRQDEGYYGRDTESTDSASGRWHYPANFQDTEVDLGNGGGKKKKKSQKQDRWARTEDARMAAVEDGGKKKKKKKSKRSAGDTWEDRSSLRNDSIAEGPEDAVGGLYGNGSARPHTQQPEERQREEQEAFDHQF